MKKFLICLLVFLPCSLLMAEKHALIIAIGKYERSTGWNDLNSANDVPILKAALISRGFKEKNIVSYVDGLDKEAIVNAIKKDLINKVKPGDVVFFHFSGHGQQILDDNGDEADGLDEALVPYNAPVNFFIKSPTTGRPEEYDGSLHLRDDELGLLMTELRKIIGSKGNLMVSIDACHSGTATRGGITRGASEPNVPKNWQGPSGNSSKEDYGFGLDEQNAALAPMVCFFGSSAHESNKEHSIDGKGVGSLSFALSKVLTEADQKVSYRALFDMVKTQMAAIVPNQTPQLEGPADQVIFGGELLPKSEYLTVKEWINQKNVKINAGVLQNLTEGSEVAFYPPDTRDWTAVKPLASGKVTQSGYAESTITLIEGSLEKEQAQKSWCLVRERNVKNSKVKVLFQVMRKDYEDALLEYFKEYPHIEPVKELSQAELLIEVGMGTLKNEIRLSPVENYTIALHLDTIKNNEKIMSAENLNRLTKKITNYSQARTLRPLDVAHPELKAELIIVPLTLKAGGDSKNLNDFTEGHPSQIQDENGSYVIPVGTFVRFKLKNNSSHQVFYNILDIDPYNKVSVLFPTKSMSPSDCMVKGFTMAEHNATRFRIREPYGTDILKVVISKKPLDLKSIYASEGVGGQRGAGSSVERLFGNSFRSDISTRSPDDEPLELEDLAIYSVSFTIVPVNP